MHQNGNESVKIVHKKIDSMRCVQKKKGGVRLDDHLEALEFVHHRVRMFDEIYQRQVQERGQKARPIKVNVGGKEVDDVCRLPLFFSEHDTGWLPGASKK